MAQLGVSVYRVMRCIILIYGQRFRTLTAECAPFLQAVSNEHAAAALAECDALKAELQHSAASIAALQSETHNLQRTIQELKVSPLLYNLCNKPMGMLSDGNSMLANCILYTRSLDYHHPPMQQPYCRMGCLDAGCKM